MAGAVAVGDVLAIIQLCQELGRLVADIKDAPTEYESFVHSLRSMHATFSCVSEAVQSSFAAESQAVVRGQTEVLPRSSKRDSVDKKCSAKGRGRSEGAIC